MRIIVEHLHNLTGLLRAHGRSVALANQSTVLGMAREGVAKILLADNLPKTVSYLTGEIFDSNDARSGQIDLIVYPSSSPRLNLNGEVHLVLSDFVIAAIEVKSNLTTADLAKSSHLKSALDACVRVKSLKRLYDIKGQFKIPDKGTYDVTLTKTPYIIFAYDGPTHDTLEKKLLEYKEDHQLSDDFMPDVIMILSKDYTLTLNNGWLGPKEGSYIWMKNENAEEALTSLYSYLLKLIEASTIEQRYMPFSAYLSNL